MHSSTQIISLVLPLLLLGLVATAVIAFYRIRAFGLPIPIATAIATLVLPLITGAGMQRAHRLASRSNEHLASAKTSISWSSFVAFMLLVIFDTVIATLALDNMVPPSDLVCPLERHWTQLFSSKNVAIIRTIQERHQCCGFRSVQQMPWPFPDRSHTAASCAQTFGRQQGCLGGWRQDQQITAGLMLLVAIVVFVLKLVMLVLYRTRNPFVFATWSARAAAASENGESESASDEGHGNNIRGQIEGAYHDEPDNVQLGNSQLEGRDNGQGNGQGPVMQPSRLHNDDNEWRET